MDTCAICTHLILRNICRDAMGIVHSKVLGGSNLYGSSDGKGIVEVGKGAYRYVLFWCIMYVLLYAETSPSTQSHIEIL